MTCLQQHSQLQTTTQQLRAIHEYAKHPLRCDGSPRRYGGSFLAVESVREVARVLEEDDRKVAWVGRAQNAPPGWPVMQRTAENCLNQSWYVAMRDSGYAGTRDISYGRTPSGRVRTFRQYVAMLCSMRGCGHVEEAKGPHGQRVYPSPWYIGRASRAKVILLAEQSLDGSSWVSLTQLVGAAHASEYAGHSNVFLALSDMARDVPEEGSLGNAVLYAELEHRVPDLRELVQRPISLGTVWDPSRHLPSAPTTREELRDLRDMPVNCVPLLEAVRVDLDELSNNGESSSSLVQLRGRSGGLEPAATFGRPYADALLDARTRTKLLTRLVVVGSHLLDTWRPLLQDVGLRELCWGTVLDQAKDRRVDEVLRWTVEAGQQLMLQRVPLTRALLAREASVDRSTVGRHWDEIRQQLQEWWERVGRDQAAIEAAVERVLH